MPSPHSHGQELLPSVALVYTQRTLHVEVNVGRGICQQL